MIKIFDKVSSFTEKEKGNLASAEPVGADDDNKSFVEGGKPEISTNEPIEAETSVEEKAKTLKKSPVTTKIKALLVKTKSYFSFVFNIKPTNSSNYVNLAPSNNADKNGVYSKALWEAILDEDVTNIALTGPYGSGKSSIIKTFVKNYEKPFLPLFGNKKILNISLASFLPSADNTKSAEKDTPSESGKITESEEQKAKNTNQDLKQEIERSILQQMIYKVEAKHLPLSRIKRIQSPNSWRPAVSFFTLIGALSCWYLYNQRLKILSCEFFMQFDFSNRVLWFKFSCLAAGILLLWSLIHRIYMMSFGLSIKGISLKEVAITPHAIDKESILNRHLDEIIYFFQATKYDLVVIEDLDRFDNQDIFVTLREINGLINANSGIRRKVCFLYALRDDMFTNTDRTKFFESIIPVIPIINSTNSIDKVLEHVKRLNLKKSLDERFLREVSRYLNDLRLIINIFKEYEIYIKNLDGNNENTLDANKLLAVLIYKNTVPNDFESLHRDKGKLAKIFEKYDELITLSEARNKSEIHELELEIRKIEERLPLNLNELRSAYIMAILSKIPQQFHSIDAIGHNNILIKDLLFHSEIDSIIEAQTISYRITSGHNPILVNIVNLQKEVHPNKSYKQRKEEIENKSADFVERANQRISELRANFYYLRGRKFNEILRENSKETESIFDAFGENKDLLKYLVLEGYIDDRYSDYTSLFHSDSGRLSSNDNKFLKKIRGYNSPEPDFKIDNPNVVINEMRGSDFSQDFALNKTLVDFIFTSPDKYREKIDNLLAFISSNFNECEAFFEVYYKSGKYVSEFLAALIDKWEGFVSAAIGSSTSATHVGRMLAHLPEKYLEEFQINNPDLIEFISHRLSEVLALKIDFEPARLKCLKFEIEYLASIENYPAELRLLFDEGLYKISVENIDFIFKSFLSATDMAGLKTKHYSTVLKTENAALIGKVDSDFEYYLGNVLLQLENNSEEDVSTILKVINHEEIDLEQLKEFLAKQSAKLPLLNEVPSRLYTTALQLNKIEPIWENGLRFISDENFDPKILTNYLQEATTLESLKNVTISKDYDECSLQNFIINNSDFSDDIYRTYVQCIPTQFEKFPEALTEEKLKILIEEQKIEFSEHNFSLLSSFDLQLLFIVKNIDFYLKKEHEIEIDDDFRHELLNTSISDEQKLKIIEIMNLTIINSMPNRAALIGTILDRTRVDIANIDATAAITIITSSKPIETKISLFNKLQRILDDDQVREVIKQLPSPFCDIRPSYSRPLFKKTEVNIAMVKWLENRRIISSSSETMFGDLRVYNFQK